MNESVDGIKVARKNELDKISSYSGWGCLLFTLH